MEKEFKLLAESCGLMGRQRAADIYGRLAASVADVPADVFEEHRQLFDDLRGIDCWDEMVLSVGLDYFPETAEKFIRDFIAEQTNP
jgi:hypothetical protein